VVLVEDPLFFNQFDFQRAPLAYHRLTMEAYRNRLSEAGRHVSVIRAETLQRSADVFRFLPDHLRCVVILDVHDDWLRNGILSGAERAGITVEFLDTPGFLLSHSDLESLSERGERRRMTQFYRKMRTEMDVLLTADNGPLGGQWSFDSDNRKKIPREHGPPAPVAHIHGNAAHAAAAALQEELPPYPITSEDSEGWLEEFVIRRLELFGPYEDAIDNRDDRWYHSLLTPMLNIGLITPRQVLNRVMQEADHRRSQGNPIPLNSLEGFVRQLIGWREFMRVTYHYHGRRMRTTNFWNHTRQVPKAFYDGTTGIPPVDEVIAKTKRIGWAHHIERLMVVGNVMLLCEFDPDAVYRWFMEFFVDAYDWVMVPNVYAMSQYADGGLITTKPYISGSNYLRRMSNVTGGEWQDTWDGLYWRFIDRHREFFSSNPRLSLMPNQLDRLNHDRRTAIFRSADRFLETL
jgi:deoxyribodipyrimidine photolyase-related protein